MAARDIEPDTVLFTIPRRSIICVSTSRLVAELPHVFAQDETVGDDDDDRTQDPWSMLILVMLYEYLQGDQSPWRPYFDVLPTEFDTPMYWTQPELKELQASSVVPRIGRDQVSKMITDKILPVIRAHEHVFFPAGRQILDNEALAALAHRLGSTIMAYAFDLDKDEDDQAGQDEEDGWVEDRDGRIMMGMVPMADILNADAEFNAHIDHGEDALTATALRPIQAGEEILNYYGPLPNGELLRRYGYVSEKHARYDIVELPWELVGGRIRESLKIDQAAWDTLVGDCPKGFGRIMPMAFSVTNPGRGRGSKLTSTPRHRHLTRRISRTASSSSGRAKIQTRREGYMIRRPLPAFPRNSQSRSKCSSRRPGKSSRRRGWMTRASARRYPSRALSRR